MHPDIHYPILHPEEEEEEEAVMNSNGDADAYSGSSLKCARVRKDSSYDYWPVHYAGI